MLTPKKQTKHTKKQSSKAPLEQFDNKCVCEICTCGKHHCPPRCVPFNGESTNHHDYKAYEVTVEREKPCRHQYAERHYDADSLKTSYKHDYEAYNIEAHKNGTEKSQYRRNNQPFYGETEYNKKYLPHEIDVERAKPSRQQYASRHYDADSLQTSYKHDYEAYKIEAHKSDTKKSQYRRNNQPFYGETEYNKKYLPHEITVERPQTTCVNGYSHRNKAKFEGTSTYDAQFSPKRLQKVQQVKHTYQRNKIPFTGESMYNSQYKPHHIQVEHKHQCTFQPSGNRNRFMGESRYNEEFRAYQIERPEVCPIEVMPKYPRCSPNKNHVNYSAEKRTWE